MVKNSIILGIETSCDETAVAVVKDSKKCPKICIEYCGKK